MIEKNWSFIVTDRDVRQTVATDKTASNESSRTSSTDNHRCWSPSSARKTTPPTGTARRAVMEFSNHWRTEPHQFKVCVSFFFLVNSPFTPNRRAHKGNYKLITVIRIRFRKERIKDHDSDSPIQWFTKSQVPTQDDNNG